ETAGDEQLALARHHLHLGAEQLAAQVGPRETRRHADALLDLGLPETEAVRAEVVGEALRRDADARLAVALHDLHGDLPTHCRYLTLEAPDTRFLGVVADDAHHRGVGEHDVVRLEAVGLALLRDQVLLGDV